MTKIIGMEYIIGNAFIYYIKERKQRYIEVRNINFWVSSLHHRVWPKENLDCLIRGNIYTACVEFNDFFNYDENAHLVTLNKDITLNDLEYRFSYYLPNNVANSLSKNAYLLLENH